MRRDSTQSPFHQFVEEIAGFVRSAIKKMLALTESTKEVTLISLLDAQLARGGQPRPTESFHSSILDPSKANLASGCCLEEGQTHLGGIGSLARLHEFVT